MDEIIPATQEPMYTKGVFRGMTPNVIRLGVVSFFADVSSEMLYPIIPIFLVSVLGAMHAFWAPALLGVIEGSAEATASLMRVVSGSISDRTGKRKPFIFGGYFLSALAKGLLALATIWPMVLFARVCDRLGKGIRVSPRDAMVADSVSAEYRGLAFGWHRAFDTAGSAIGPVLTLLLLYLMTGSTFSARGLMGAAEIHTLRVIMLIAVIPGLIGALVTLTAREPRKPPAPGAKKPSLRFDQLPVPFRQYIIGWSIFALVNSSDMFLILRAKYFGLSTITVILVYTMYNLVYAFASPVLGKSSDKIGRKTVLVGGLIVFALVYLGFGLAAHAWQIWALFAIYGLYTAATDGVGKAFIIDLVSPDIRGGAVGLLNGVAGVATLLASLVAGLLWARYGFWATFIYGAIGAVISACFLWAIRVPAMKTGPEMAVK